MRELLAQYPSLTEPVVLIFVVSLFLLLASVFVIRPNLFIPVFLVCAPLPKLFALGYSESTAAYNSFLVTKAPGISLVDIVALAGLAAFLLSRLPSVPRRGVGSNLSYPIRLCAVSVALSLVIGALFSANVFHPSQILYAGRHVAVLGCFFLARRYALADRRGRSPLSSAFDAIRKPGHVIILLGLVYYYFIGHDAAARSSDTEGLSRSFLWFFDYSYDFGFYITLVALLDIAQTMRGRARRTTIGYCVFWLVICAAAIQFAGERGNIIVFATALITMIVYMARDFAAARGGRVNTENLMIFAGFLSIIFLAVFFVLAPKNLISKIESGSEAQQFGTIETAGQQVDLPASVTSFVAALPIGDWGLRLILNLGSVQYFLNHPWGVGYGGELYGVGWFAHYELTTIAVEQGAFGLFCYALLLWRLLVLSTRAVRNVSVDEQYSFLVMRVLIFAFIAASVFFSIAAIFLQKFTPIFWLLLGVFDASLTRDVSDRRTSNVTARTAQAGTLGAGIATMPSTACS